MTQEQKASATRRRFDDKVVLVTGASGGLGSVQAALLAREGGTIVLADAAVERGEAAAAALRDSGASAIFVALDVASPDSWAQALASIKKQFGCLHVLVNNAGIVSRTSVRSVSIDEWRRVLDVNLTGALLGIQAAAPLIRDSGGGAVVNIGSTSAMIGHPGVAYTTSKWALRGLTRSAALDFLEWGIRVNCVHPSQIAGTGITTGAAAGWRHASERVSPAKRPVLPEEVGQAVLFLASDEASYINATDLVVDGGTISIGLPRVRNLMEEDFNAQRGAGGSP